MTAISPDGSRIYFVAKGALTHEPNGQGQRARAGGENLYVYDSEAPPSQPTLTFIATLAPADEAQWSGGVGGADVTPTGEFLVFTSHRALTPDVTRAEGPAQVYEYDAVHKLLKRISIGSNGFGDNGNAGLGDASIATSAQTTEAASTPARTDPTMSDNAAFVFFKSSTGLTPQALDNVQVTVSGSGAPVYAQNIYEYHEGKVALISDGKDVAEPNRVAANAVELLGSDTEGRNVFFSTVDRLLPEDIDTQRDYYDAHMCSAAQPCEGSHATPQVCVQEQCQAAPGAPPQFGTPSSSTPSGEGNLSPSSASGRSPTRTRAQKLAAALKVCHTRRRKHKRKLCEASARSRYGTKTKPHKSGRSK